jgi:hypothetical protein
MRRKSKVVGKAVLALAAAALLGLIVMALWNTVATAVFARARPVDYPHAIGLLVLCRILFGGFRGGGGWRRGRRCDKWQSLTPEERDAIRERMTTAGKGTQP